MQRLLLVFAAQRRHVFLIAGAIAHLVRRPRSATRNAERHMIDPIAEHRHDAISRWLETVSRAATAAEFARAAGVLADREMAEAQRIAVLGHLDRHEIRHALRRDAMDETIAALVGAVAARIGKH